MEPIGHLVQLRRETLRESFNIISDAHSAVCQAIRLLRAVQDTFPVDSENWTLYHQETNALGNIAHTLYQQMQQSTLRRLMKGHYVYVPEGKVAHIEDAEPASEAVTTP